MARTKADHKGTIRGTGALIWVDPVYPNTVTGRAGTIPAIDATGPDGRRWFITLESEYSAKFDGTSRAGYIKRMRGIAEALLKEAVRMELNPDR